MYVNAKTLKLILFNNYQWQCNEYDTLSRLNRKVQTVGSITKDLRYAYNSAGQLSSITYPSGLVVNYIYTKGLVTSVTVSGAVVGTVLDLATYQPFDNSFPKTYRFNSKKNRVMNFDTNEKLTGLTVDSVFNDTFTMDGVGNYLSILDNLDSTKSIVATYDTNNKINLFTQNNQSFQPYYDSSYNRTSSSNTINGQSLNFTYDYNTNRLNSYSLNGTTSNLTYDNNGNTLTEGPSTYTYDLRNNLVNYGNAGVNSTYGFNSLGQRTIKTTGGVTTYFLYDESANLVGEYDASGNTVSEHIYLNGVPVGLVKSSTLYYVHTDQLGTPRAITNNANTVVWKWDSTDAFGSNLPSVTTVAYNKRFPGQYFDNESKLHYNYYRTYNPVTGRYIQSDPLGLAAGFNTYSYVGSNPLGAVDQLGLIDSGAYSLNQDFINSVAGFGDGVFGFNPLIRSTISWIQGYGFNDSVSKEDKDSYNYKT
jgi:RHS repeat-associated protein